MLPTLSKLEIQNQDACMSIGMPPPTESDLTLSDASMEGNLRVVQRLLKNGEDANKRNQIGDTPLHRASVNGHIEVVKLLLNREADINLVDRYRQTPLKIASQEGHIEVVQLLLNREAAVDQADINGRTPLRSASEHCHIGVVRALLNRQADVNLTDINGKTPMHVALDVSRPSRENPYHRRQCAIKVVKLLLDNQADVNASSPNGITPIYLAAQNAYWEVAKLLLDKNANVNQQNDNGSTPLHAAIFSPFYNRLLVMQVLLDNGAEVNIADRTGKTPLYFATLHYFRDLSEKVVKLLIDKKANVDQEDIDGITPLQAARMKENNEIVRILLDSKPSHATSRQELRKRLYPLVEARVPTRADTITSTLLVKLDDDEVLHLLESSQALNAQIAQAIAELHEYEAGENERGSDERRERERQAHIAVVEANDALERQEAKVAELKRKLQASLSRAAKAAAPPKPYTERQEPPRSRKAEKKQARRDKRTTKYESMGAQLEHEVHTSEEQRALRADAFDMRQLVIQAEADARKARERLEAAKKLKADMSAEYEAAVHVVPPRSTLSDIIGNALDNLDKNGNVIRGAQSSP